MPPYSNGPSITVSAGASKTWKLTQLLCYYYPAVYVHNATFLAQSKRVLFTVNLIMTTLCCRPSTSPTMPSAPGLELGRVHHDLVAGSPR